MKKKIVIVEDEESIRELLKCTLEAFSYNTVLYENGEDMLNDSEVYNADLILLDVMLPHESGFEIIKRIKASSNLASIPVIFISAKTSEVDKVKGLDLGAEDYIAKPFGTLELAARVRAALRRTGREVASNEIIELNGISINLSKREVFKGETPINLSLKEFELLRVLMTNDRVLHREALINEVWGYDFLGETRTLDMHIKSLRSKLSDDAENPTYIKTVRGVGYIFLK